MSNAVLDQINSTLSLDYQWTRDVAQYSRLNIVTLGVPLCLVAIVETIVEVAKVPLKLVGLIAICPKEEKGETAPILSGLSGKKIIYITGAVVGFAAIAYLGYRAFSPAEISLPIRSCPLVSGSMIEESAYTPGFDPAEHFVSTYEKMEQCPTIDTFIQNQAENGYWGWSLSNMRRLFGSARDLTLEEARLGFYHQKIQENIPKIAQAHPSFQGSDTKEIAEAISGLRNTAREYTRERSWLLAHKWLELMEPRNGRFEQLWQKYGCNATALIEGAMRSNAAYDNVDRLRFLDRAFQWYLPEVGIGLALSVLLCAIGKTCTCCRIFFRH